MRGGEFVQPIHELTETNTPINDNETIKKPDATSKAEDGTVFVEPSKVLQIKKQNEKQRFGEESSRILNVEQIDELLTQEQTLTKSEFELLNDLSYYLNMGRAGLQNNKQEEQGTDGVLTNIASFLKKSAEREVEPDSQSAAIRRTAILVYKSARIPGQQQYEGSFKTGTAPIGIGVQKIESKQVRDAFVYEQTNDVLNWNGNVALEEEYNIPQREQFILVKNKEGANQIVESVVEELKLVKKLSETTDKETILPEVHGIGKESGYVEYLPGHPFTTDISLAAQRTAKVAKGLKHVLDETGVLNTDIKGDNIRLRANGEPVVFDWGCAVELGKDTKHITIEQFDESGFSTHIMPPEMLTAIVFGNQDQEFDTEKVLVYQCAAAMLEASCGQTKIMRALNAKAGYEWPFSLGQNQECSITDATVDYIAYDTDRLRHNEKAMEVLKKALNTIPSRRPNIEEFVQLLEEI